MSELNFRIIIVPENTINKNEKDELLSEVMIRISHCGLDVISINYSQLRKSADEDYPELEELSIQVQAKTRSGYQRQKAEEYKEFCIKWIKFSKFRCAYIVLYGNDCFIRTKQSHYKEKYEKLSFGVLPHNGLFHEYASLSPSIGNVDFYHDTRNVVIHSGEYEMTFSYDDIRNVFVNIQNRPREIYFDLFNPPIILRSETVYSRSGKSSYPLKHRNLNLQHLQGLNTNMPGIDTDILGRANILSLTLSSHECSDEILSGIHYHCSEKSIFYSCISQVEKDKPSDPIIECMHFGCTYLITAILKRNFVAVAQANDIYSNLDKLNSLSEQNPDCLENALTAVLSALDSGKILNFWQAIDDQYYFYTTNKDEINFKDYIVPPKCRMIRRVMLTPTRQLLWAPEIMYENRVLRNFDSDYALRVSFRDDNMFKLNFYASRADVGVLDSCIKNPMTNGIRIGSRHYDFLAWSNSQIRDHGVWMYARDTQGKTAAHIREWMGDFSHIHNVPKYMARMGQCFTRTEDALSVPLDPQHVRTEDDIKGGFDLLNEKPYCFTDGIGKISSELASKVHDALGHDKLCSAFQIRYGGYKGMLVTDPTLKDVQIVFRNSMKKFDSPENRLEIAETSSPIALRLSTSFIALLNDLGVHRRTFLRFQEEMLNKLTDMLINESDAAEFLKTKTPFKLFDYEDLSQSGIYLTSDPFFKSLLLTLHRQHIGNIKSRANITIDPSEGRNMFGVVDETGKLEYGQVFVQCTTDISFGETMEDTTIVKGVVLVTKNPCMYPGDVRKFQAVDIPELHHIVDCIVFPQKGPRPHPNEMAGSDMDGDEYSVLWHPDLIFEGPNEQPAHFPEVTMNDVDCINVPDMIDFLQKYIANDQIGRIGNAHTAHADNKGVRSEVCLSIAKKFSVAIDFAKNGSTQKLDRNERPAKFPDFMEKYDREIYKSKKALGKIYRICRDFESENQEVGITYKNIEVDPDLELKGWERYEDSAVKSRNKYNGLLRSVLSNYGIQHEAEALSGAFTNLHCRFQKRNDLDEIKKVIIGCIKKLSKSMQKEFLAEFHESGDLAVIKNKILQKASAWYIVTYSDPHAKFLSFPWTISEYLVKIKITKTLGNPPLFSPAIMCLDEKIRECESRNLLPHYVETKIWNNYTIVCDPLILRQTLRTLILWAQDEEIVGTPHRSQGLLRIKKFKKLFLHVANLQGYVLNKSERLNKFVSNNRKAYSSGHLCIEFLKFCSSLRFYNKSEIHTILRFTVRKYKRLAKRAVVSYHGFALSGRLLNLYFDEKKCKKLIQMAPIQIKNKIFSKSPVDPASLRKAEGTLIEYSKVDELTIREHHETKNICVSAMGSETAIKDLRCVLRKENKVLRRLFGVVRGN